MTWQVEHESTIPVLTNGEYALLLSVEQLARLRGAGNVGALQHELWEIAGQQRIPAKGHTALQDALKADGSISDALAAILAALKEPKQ